MRAVGTYGSGCGRSRPLMRGIESEVQSACTCTCTSSVISHAAISFSLMAAAGCCQPGLNAYRRGRSPNGRSGVRLPDGFSRPSPGRWTAVRHGYATENTWYNPGWLHTGEDWYLPEGETPAVWGSMPRRPARSSSPARSTPVGSSSSSTPDDLFSMYGHLDYALSVALGQSVERGQPLGAPGPDRRSRPQPPSFRDTHLLHDARGQRRRAPLRIRMWRRLPTWSGLLADRRARASLGHRLAQPDACHQPPVPGRTVCRMDRGRRRDDGAGERDLWTAPTA